MPTSHPGFPARPLLRPGVQACRRADGELQVGLDPALAVVAADSPAVREVLEGLRDGVAPAPPSSLEPDASRLCAALLARDLVVDADDVLPALARSADDTGRRAVAAVYAEHGAAAPSVLAGRSRVRVDVEAGRMPDAGRRCADLFAAAGLAGPGGPTSAVLHLSDSEPDRELLDTWVRDDLPHLLVTTVEGIVRVGPFVVPGRTACLRCVDAHLSERDPRRGLVVQQYAARSPREDPLPADLWQLATAFAVRDVVRWVDGQRPRTWSATVHVDPALELPLTAWTRHPGCGCAWGPGLAAG